MAAPLLPVRLYAFPFFHPRRQGTPRALSTDLRQLPCCFVSGAEHVVEYVVVGLLVLLRDPFGGKMRQYFRAQRFG